MGLESVYTSPTTLRSTTAEDERYEFIPSPHKSKPDTIAKMFLSRSRDGIARLYLSTCLSVSSLTRRISPAHNCSGFTTNPNTPPSALFPQNNNLKGEVRARAVGVALADVWDGREELFGVSKAEDEDKDKARARGALLRGDRAFCEMRNLQKWADGSA